MKQIILSLSPSHLALMFIAGAFLLMLKPSDASTGAPSGSRWERHDPKNGKPVDHGGWQAFLNRHLDTTGSDGVHRIRYGKVSPKDKAHLEAYLVSLQKVPVAQLNRDEQKAYWINLYNATTISLVLRKYPVESIRDIRFSPGPADGGPWDDKVLRVDGDSLSLNDIESRILRPLWKDNRVHFALNCASVGCPNLSAIAFTAANMEGQLAGGALSFIGSARGAVWDGKAFTLSSIFDWYRQDFGGADHSVLETLSRFAKPEIAEKMKRYTGKIAYQYDWKLNDADGN